jgi:hypothetical protein
MHDNVDLLAYFRSILNTWKNYFCPLLSAHGVNDVRQAEMQTAEPLIPEPSQFEAQITIEKFKSKKSPDIDQIPAELIQADCNTLIYEIHKLIYSI